MKPYYEHNGVTIYHGDCRSVLPELSVCDLVLTDPPYGIGLTSHGHFSERSIVGDHDQSIGREMLAYFEREGAPVIAFADPMQPWPGQWRQHLVWDKGLAVGSGGDPSTCWRFDWEMIQVARTGILANGRDSSILHYHVDPRFGDFSEHPAQKPTALLSYLIRKADSGSPALIVDPFMGSGSTLIAAKGLGHSAIGIEIEEKYCEIAARRLSQEVFEFT